MANFVVNFKELEGKEFYKIEVIEESEIRFYLSDKVYYAMEHTHDCCESVTIDDICGDLTSITNCIILEAREETSEENPEGVVVPEFQDSFTWTFYIIRTMLGTVTIRWYGESNGYYSESVTTSLIIGG